MSDLAGKGRRAIPIGLVLGLIVALVSPTEAVAAAPTIPFQGVFYPCSFGNPTEEWSSGNVLHFRGATNHNLWVTGEPLLDGFADNVVDADINLKTGTGVARPRETLSPAAVEGTWEITVMVSVDPTGLTARGDGYGTGELQGMTIEFENPGIVGVPPGTNPCSDVPEAVLISGEIRTPS